MLDLRAEERHGCDVVEKVMLYFVFDYLPRLSILKRTGTLPGTVRIELLMQVMRVDYFIYKGDLTPRDEGDDVFIKPDLFAHVRARIAKRRKNDRLNQE